MSDTPPRRLSRARTFELIRWHLQQWQLAQHLNPDAEAAIYAIKDLMRDFCAMHKVDSGQGPAGPGEWRHRKIQARMRREERRRRGLRGIDPNRGVDKFWNP